MFVLGLYLIVYTFSEGMSAVEDPLRKAVSMFRGNYGYRVAGMLKLQARGKVKTAEIRLLATLTSMNLNLLKYIQSSPAMGKS
jgi:hypothetical protein